MKIIKTGAQAMWVSARTETKDPEGGGVSIANEGQSCIALVPVWANYGRTLLDGTELEGGKYYKITIEIDD